MAFVDDVKLHSEKVRKNLPHVQGEEATKMALILPFLQVMGFDIYDPAVLKPEFAAEGVAIKTNGKPARVDYALHAGGQPIILIECKAFDPHENSLPKHDVQVAAYFPFVRSAQVAILTNGVHYRFFTDLQENNLMDHEPFFEFDVTQYTDHHLEILSHLTAPLFQVDKVKECAKGLCEVDKVRKHLSTLILSPSESFVKFLVHELQLTDVNVTARIIEKFAPIVRAAFAGAVLDVTARGLSQMTTPPTTAPAEPVATTAASSATSDELRLVERVKTILIGSSSNVSIGYKNTRNYLAVNIGNVWGWFLRFYVKGPKKFVVVRIPHGSLNPKPEHMSTLQLDPNETRVDVASEADVDGLAALIRAAYAQQVQQRHGDSAS